MYDGDGNIYALNKYLDDADRADNALEEMWDDLKHDVNNIEMTVKYMLKYAANFEYGGSSYDFTDHIEEWVKHQIV